MRQARNEKCSRTCETDRVIVFGNEFEKTTLFSRAATCCTSEYIKIKLIFLGFCWGDLLGKRIGIDLKERYSYKQMFDEGSE